MSMDTTSPVYKTCNIAWQEFKRKCKVLDAQHDDKWFAYLHQGVVGFLVKRNTNGQEYIMIIMVSDRIYHIFDETLEMLFQQCCHRCHDLASHQKHRTHTHTHPHPQPQTKSQLLLISGWHQHRALSNMDCYAAVASILDEDCDMLAQTQVQDVIMDRITHFTHY
jgi:hypothetical protein